MKIWAHTMFKNSERWLWFSVSSVINYVDKLLLWDTGSTDNSWRIAKLLKEKYKERIDLREYGEITSESFPKARQAMLDVTDSDWFLMVDDDEIWWRQSIEKVISEIKNEKNRSEAVVVPTINLIGDIYHFQRKSEGKYRFGNLKGHYNLRAIKRDIDGLHSQGLHGNWGWADDEGKQIQDRNTFKFVDAPYLHATFLPRSNNVENDRNVPKRSKKIKFEIGEKFPLDFYYPEVLFEGRPDFLESPWDSMNVGYKTRAMIETPLKRLKRRIINDSRVGY